MMEKNKGLRWSKIDIFNTKMNLDKCSQLLKMAMDNEKKLFLIPYAKKKEKINKTIDTIGDANGIPYPDCNVIQGNSLEDKNYLNIMRDNDMKMNSSKKTKKFRSTFKNNNSKEVKEFDLENDLKEINVQDFNL